jgi:hypothetical protein
MWTGSGLLLSAQNQTKEKLHTQINARNARIKHRIGQSFRKAHHSAVIGKTGYAVFASGYSNYGLKTGRGTRASTAC